MVVSSTVADPLESFSQLLIAQKQSEQQSKYPKWLTPHLLYQYVLLHDLTEGGDERCVCVWPVGVWGLRECCTYM